MTRLVRFLSLLIALAPTTSFGQATKRINNAAESQDVCLTANVAGTLTDAICARGAGGVELKGRTDGTATCSTCIGYVVTGNLTSSSSLATSGGATTDVPSATLSVGSGTWLVNVSAKLRTTVQSGNPDLRLVIRDSDNNSKASREWCESVQNFVNHDFAVSMSVPVTLTAATTLKLGVFQESGTSTTTVIGSGGGNTYFNAVRLQ